MPRSPIAHALACDPALAVALAVALGGSLAGCAPKPPAVATAPPPSRGTIVAIRPVSVPQSALAPVLVALTGATPEPEPEGTARAEFLLRQPDGRIVSVTAPDTGRFRVGDTVTLGTNGADRLSRAD